MSATDDGLLLDLYERETDRHRQTDKRGRARGREIEEEGGRGEEEEERERDAGNRKDNRLCFKEDSRRKT